MIYLVIWCIGQSGACHLEGAFETVQDCRETAIVRIEETFGTDRPGYRFACGNPVADDLGERVEFYPE